MKIGIDLSVLQTGHRMRGIGSMAINFINNISTSDKNRFEFVFFVLPYDANDIDPLDQLNLESVNYEIRLLKVAEDSHINLPSLAGKILKIGLRHLRIRRNMWFGDTRLDNLKDIDYFLQFDQNQPLPAKHKVRSAIVMYDIIPYILESDYLWSYRTARIKGCSVKGAIRHHLRRKQYKSNTRSIARKADTVIAISKCTKRDLVNNFGINPDKIKVCLLGIDKKSVVDTSLNPDFSQYLPSSWGYMPKKVSMEGKEFLLFVGGADPRRKIVELVAAFNNLRAQGYDIKLVLVGDTMFGAFNVPNVELQNYLKNTSYLDDIYFMGFVDNKQRDWLYSKALAFVYPSVYEGFGLPVIEAMQYGTPVMTYQNSSITEVAGDSVIYTDGYQTIVEAVKKLYNNENLSNKYSSLGKSQSDKFSWEATSKNLIQLLIN